MALDKNCLFGYFLSFTNVRMDSLIFSEPLFIRRNILLNCLYSNFKPEEFSSTTSINNFTDVLRATYHNLSPLNIGKDKIHAITLAFNILSHNSDNCTDIDWMYIERIIIHFVNINRTASNRIYSLLSRRALTDGIHSTVNS